MLTGFCSLQNKTIQHVYRIIIESADIINLVLKTMQNHYGELLYMLENMHP